MTIYYTAKDIEEMAARGIRQLEIGPGITLTDFARETAQQVGIILVRPAVEQASPQVATPTTTAPRPAPKTSKYSKPSGCMHGSSSRSVTPFQERPASNTGPSSSSGTVNRLIDLMGKAINRG